MFRLGNVAWGVAVAVALAACAVRPDATQLDQEQYAWVLERAEASLPLATEVSVWNETCGPRGEEPCPGGIPIYVSFRSYDDFLASDDAIRALNSEILEDGPGLRSYVIPIDLGAGQRDAELAESIATSVPGLAGAHVRTGEYAAYRGTVWNYGSSLTLYVDNPEDITVEQMSLATSMARDGLASRNAEVAYLSYLPARFIGEDPDSWEVSHEAIQIAGVESLWHIDIACIRTEEWALKYDGLGFAVLPADSPEACSP